MRYKIKYKGNLYLVKAKDAKTAVDALAFVAPSIEDDRLSPMTYAKLKELGYSHDDWINLTQVQANKIVAQSQSKTGKIKPTTEKPSTINKQSSVGTTAVTGENTPPDDTNKSKHQPKDVTKNSATPYDDKKLSAMREKNKDLIEKAKALMKYKSTKDFVNSVNSHKYYSIDAVKNLPVLKEMDSIIDEYNARNGFAHKDNSEERNRERKYIINELKKRGSFSGKDENGNAKWEGKLKNEGKVVIAIGLPAAGKSSVIAEPRSKELGAFVLDSDEAKFIDPRFVSSDGIAADSIHDDSQQIVHTIMEDFMKTKTNFIIPIIGSKTSKIYEKWINKLLENGYKKEDITIELKEADVEGSTNRVLRRAVTDKRPIKSQVIFKYGSGPSKALQDLQRDGFKTIVHPELQR